MNVYDCRDHKREDDSWGEKNLEIIGTIVFKAGRWADTTQGERTDRKEVREIETSSTGG